MNTSSIFLYFSLIGSVMNLKFISVKNKNSFLQVNLINGIIQGKKVEGINGMIYYSYQGIPYAAPPIGNLRFKSPQPGLKWNNILDATKEGDICMQHKTSKPMSEDCLFINVYTTKEPNNRTKLQPVMVWIYGGAFIKGRSDSDIYGPDYLLTKNVIIVTFNYRVGIFGFLNTGTLASPGNYGIKDQIKALKWVQENIISFGGDKSNVTIFGESAGGASVNYLILAPKANGLFHKAISQSGSALCPWAFQRNSKEITKNIARIFGLNSIQSSETLIDYLRKIDSNLLNVVAHSSAVLHSFTPLNGLAFSPSIEPKHEDAVLTDKPHELFKQGKFNKIPYIIGFNSKESVLVEDLLGYARPYLLLYDLVPTFIIPEDMNIDKVNDSIKSLTVSLKIKSQYFGYKLGQEKDDVIKYISDTQFVKPIRETVKQMSKYVSIYFYQFSYEGNLGLQYKYLNLIKKESRTSSGVGHGEDLWYIWKTNGINKINLTDISKSEQFLILWTNFAKYGNPTPNEDEILVNIIWSKTNNKNYTYLDINEKLIIRTNPKEANMIFWDNLYNEYGNPPYDTY